MIKKILLIILFSFFSLNAFAISLKVSFELKNFSENLILYKEKICSERGQISDDGDKWIDKHSGYYI